MSAAPTAPDTTTLLEFLFRLGQAYLAAGEQTATVELILRRTATAYGVRRSRVVAFPTALFVSLHEGDQERVTLAEGATQTLRLDQIADVYNLGEAAQRGEVGLREGLERLTQIHRKPARFGVPGVVVGHTVLAVGLAMLLEPPPASLAAAAVLGTIVGVLKAFNRDRPVLAVPLPVVAAGLVAGLVFLAMKNGLAVDPLYVLVPPLVAFLPGGMLTLGMVELAYGDMVSGSSRLVTGCVQLVLLAFGLVAGAALVGYRPEELLDPATKLAPESWLSWVGVLVFGVGAYLHFSAPRKALAWMLLVLLLAFAAQQLGAGLFGKQVSGFFGMLVATPLGYLIQRRFRGPPAIVT
ncbi:MAG: threonine/serine ThrE exporter family protein, partial [Gemmataceae bacterium]